MCVCVCVCVSVCDFTAIEWSVRNTGVPKMSIVFFFVTDCLFLISAGKNSNSNLEAKNCSTLLTRTYSSLLLR